MLSWYITWSEIKNTKQKWNGNLNFNGAYKTRDNYKYSRRYTACGEFSTCGDQYESYICDYSNSQLYHSGRAHFESEMPTVVTMIGVMFNTQLIFIPILSRRHADIGVN